VVASLFPNLLTFFYPPLLKGEGDKYYKRGEASPDSPLVSLLKEEGEETLERSFSSFLPIALDELTKTAQNTTEWKLC